MAPCTRREGPFRQAMHPRSIYLEPWPIEAQLGEWCPLFPAGCRTRLLLVMSSGTVVSSDKDATHPSGIATNTRDATEPEAQRLDATVSRLPDERVIAAMGMCALDISPFRRVMGPPLLQGEGTTRGGGVRRFSQPHGTSRFAGGRDQPSRALGGSRVERPGSGSGFIPTMARIAVGRCPCPTGS
jgi:hypothetical protein